MQIKGKSLVGICSWCSAHAAAGRNLVESSVPVLIDIGRCQYRKFPKLPCVAKLETKLMMILPRIKADYDDYIHFNHIKRKIEAFYIYVHSILHVFTKI